MPNISFISNFKTWQKTIFWLLILIFTCETIIGHASKKIFYHEVDELIYQLDHTKYDSKYVLLGDSVAHQLTEVYRGNTQEFAVLTSNNAVEMAGQYFILKRYLEKNKKPSGVILVGLYPLVGKLDQMSTENYIQRVFLRWDEILELYKVRGFKFAFVMLVYKLFPSYKYRLALQEKLLRISNANPYNGILFPYNGLAYPGISGKKTIVSSSSNKTWFNFRQDNSIAVKFFEKIVKLLNEQSIDFYYIQPPIEKDIANHPYYLKFYDQMKAFFDRLSLRYKKFNYLIGVYVFPKEAYQKDEIHYTAAGKRAAQKKLDDCIKEIQKQNPG